MVGVLVTVFKAYTLAIPRDGQIHDVAIPNDFRRLDVGSADDQGHAADLYVPSKGGCLRQSEEPDLGFTRVPALR
jgi:hypothetical protein